MKVRAQHNDGDTCAIVRVDSLVFTVSRDGTGYEVLVEVDRDECAPGVNVSIGTPTDDSVDWLL